MATWPPIVYLVPLLIGALLPLLTSLLVWRRRAAPGAMTAVALMLAMAVYAVGYALELTGPDQAIKVYWSNFQRFGLSMAPTLWLILAHQYTGRSAWLSRWRALLLSIEPLVTLGLVWTNEWHHLMYTDVGLVGELPFQVLVQDLGLWGLLDVVYSYGLLAAGVLQLVRAPDRVSHLYRRQILILLSAVCVPAAAELMSVFDIGPNHLDLAPYAYALSGPLIVLGLYRYKLLDVVPVARESIIENMDDVVIVLDARDRVVDLNQTARAMLQHRAVEVIGQPVGRVMPGWADLAAQRSGQEEIRDEIDWEVDGTQQSYDLHVSPLCDQGGDLNGWLVMMHDVTTRKWAEEALENRLEQLTALGQASQAVTASLDLDQVLAEIISLAGRVIGADYTTVVLVDELGDMSRSAEDLPGVPALEFRVRERGLTDWIIRSGEMVIIDQVPEDGAIELDLGGSAPRHINPVVVEAGVKAVAGLPMIAKDRLLGVLYLHSLTYKRFGDQRSLLTAFANQAAIAIENSRLYAEQRRRAQDASVLLEIAGAISSTLELDPVFTQVALYAAQATGAGRCTLLLLDDVSQMLQPTTSQFASGDVDEQMWEMFIEARYPRRVDEIPEVLQVIEDRRPLFIPDVDHSSIPREWIDPFEIGSLLFVPLISREQVVGLMALDHARVGHAFTSEQIDLAMTISSQAAVAIENARLHQELQHYAHQLEERVQDRTAQLKAQAARLEAILNSSSDGIVVTDDRGEMLQANPIAQAWLDRTLSPEDAAQLRVAITALAQRAEALPEMLLELTGLDLELRAAPIQGAELAGAASVLTIHDVSHLKALDRVKSRFASNVSHELRTPVTTIKLYAELMRRMPENWEEYLAVLTQEADRQAKLVEDILQISRIDAGRLEMRPVPTSLSGLIKKTVSSHAVHAETKGVTLDLVLADPDPVALVDPDRMAQVLGNLVENGIRYTDEGGRVIIGISTLASDGRDWITVRVSDTGMGIPENELSHVFERFFRGEHPRKMQISGTGLGLAIVKEIVELHGGRVMVESQVGVGTTFAIWLPPAD